jgi:hypothetical protein
MVLMPCNRSSLTMRSCNTPFARSRVRIAFGCCSPMQDEFGGRCSNDHRTRIVVCLRDASSVPRGRSNPTSFLIAQSASRRAGWSHHRRKPEVCSADHDPRTRRGPTRRFEQVRRNRGVDRAVGVRLVEGRAWPATAHLRSWPGVGSRVLCAGRAALIISRRRRLDRNQDSASGPSAPRARQSADQGADCPDVLFAWRAAHPHRLLDRRATIV